jgi:hypothetical protein
MTWAQHAATEMVPICAGAGFALHVLWAFAAVLPVIWLLGFLVSGAEHSWYRVQREQPRHRNANSWNPTEVDNR